MKNGHGKWCLGLVFLSCMLARPVVVHADVFTTSLTGGQQFGSLAAAEAAMRASSSDASGLQFDSIQSETASTVTRRYTLAPVNPIATPWRYSFIRCGNAHRGYTSEADALQAGMLYYYNRCHSPKVVDAGHWGTPQHHVLGACGSSLYYPTSVHGIENYNSRSYIISDCGGSWGDSLWIDRSRHVTGCPTGYHPASDRLHCAGRLSATITQTRVQDYGPPPPGSCVGDPCDAGTGNEYLRETDYQGPAGTLRVTRSYNSLDSFDHGLGYGWVSNFTKRLVPDGNRLTVYRGDGRIEHFSLTVGGWQGEADTHLALTQDAAGYTVHLQSGALEHYDSSGRLVKEDDPAGRSTTFGYDRSDHLATITDPFGHALTFTYDGSGRLASLSDPAGHITRYGYDEAGNLTSVTYPDGTARRYSYADSHYPHALTGVALVDASGQSTSLRNFTYDNNGKVAVTAHADGRRQFDLAYDSETRTTVTNAAGRQDVLTFESQLGRKLLLSRIVQSDGHGLSQRFDARNNLVSRTDADGHTTTYTYDDFNRLTSRTEADGTADARTIDYQYADERLALPVEIDRPSVCSGATQQTLIQYNSRHEPSSLTESGYTPRCDSIRRTWTFSYNDAGQLTRIDGPRTDVPDVTTFTYHDCQTGGPCGRLDTVTDALGHTTTFDRYDSDGRVLQATDPNGIITTYAYDSRGRLTTVSQQPSTGPGRTTTFAYTPDSRLAEVVLPDGRSLTYTYDGARDLARVTDNLGDHVDYAYDSRGNRTQSQTYDPNGTLIRQVGRVYDLRNHLASVNDGGSITRTVVDSLGNLLQRTDPDNHPATTHTYDALDRMTRTVDALGSLTSFAYGPHDHTTRVETPNGAATQYRYDDFGDLLEENSPDRGTITYTYNAAGNRLTRTDARGVIATYTYDTLGRLTAIHYDSPPNSSGRRRRHSTEATSDVTLVYDEVDGCSNGLGRLCQVKDASGTISYAYDPWGNVLRETHESIAGRYRRGRTTTTTVQYHYDAGNHLLAITYPDGRKVDYTRDTLGRIETISATVDGKARTLVHDRSYRADGRLLAQTFGNGLVDQRKYTAQDRLATWTLTGQADRVYAYDPNGNLTALQTTDGSAQYQYDALDRLTDETQGDDHNAYTYDPNGNRLSNLLPNGRTETYEYVTNSNRLTRAGRRNVTLDAAGSTTADGRYEYRYNAAGRISLVMRHGRVIARYRYDYRGLRTAKRTTTGVTHYVYGPNGHLLSVSGAEASGGERDYIWTDATPIARIDARPPRVSHAPSWLSRILNRHHGRASHDHDRLIYLHTDAEGTPRLATDTHQRTVWRWHWDAFGAGSGHTRRLKYSRGRNGSKRAREAVRAQIQLRYPGQYFDSENGLIYNWHRYYDPDIARYITSDPIGVKGGLNAYTYAHDSPLVFVDPYGLFCLSDSEIDAIAAGAGGAFSGGAALSELGPAGVGLGAFFGGLTGAAVGYFSPTSEGEAMVFGAAAAIGSGANTPLSSGVGGLIGAGVGQKLQKRGLPNLYSDIAGGTVGGFAGDSTASFFSANAPESMSSALSVAARAGGVGALNGLSGAAISAAVAEALKAANDCRCGHAE